MTKYFWRGAHIRVVGRMDISGRAVSYMAEVVESFNLEETILPGTSVVVDCLTPVCSDVFKLGDPVRSTLKDSGVPFTGWAVGYEFDTNRVVCRSSRVERYKDGRTRYAYAIDELAGWDLSKPTFEAGCTYKVGKDTRVLAVEELFNPGHVSLVYTDGSGMIRNVPCTISYSDLAKHYNLYQVAKEM